VIWLMKSSSGISNRIIPGYMTYSEALWLKVGSANYPATAGKEAVI